MKNSEIIELARKIARKQGDPAPRTAADVERLTGFAYNGVDPEAIGKTYTVQVKHLR